MEGREVKKTTKLKDWWLAKNETGIWKRDDWDKRETGSWKKDVYEKKNNNELVTGRKMFTKKNANLQKKKKKDYGKNEIIKSRKITLKYRNFLETWKNEEEKLK